MTEVRVLGQQARKLIAECGAELDDNSQHAQQLVGCVIAPSGIRFKASGCHTIAMNYLTDRAAGWRALLADLRAGVEPCDTPECEMCDGVDPGSAALPVAGPASPTRRRYRHARYHRSRPDTTAVCPDPENCPHPGAVSGDSCECCGAIIP